MQFHSNSPVFAFTLLWVQVEQAWTNERTTGVVEASRQQVGGRRARTGKENANTLYRFILHRGSPSKLPQKAEHI